MAAVLALATCLAPCWAAGPAGAQDGRPRVEVPSTIDATGRTDVTDELDAFFADVPDGAIIDFPEGGRYRADGTVDIESKNRLTVRGNGSTIFARSRGDLRRVHVAITRGRDLRIERLNVEGAHPTPGLGDDGYQPDYEGQHGFAIKGTDGIELDAVQVSDVYGDFVYLGRPDDGGDWARRVWIHDSLFVRNGRQGIAITAARGVVIERNGIAQVARSTFDLEPNGPSGGAIDVQILNNQVGPGRLLFLAAAGLGPVAAVVVEGNVLTGRAMTVTILPPDGDRRDRFWIVGNNASVVARNTPIRVTRVDGLVVWRNRQPLETGGLGVETKDVCGLIVAENDFGPFTTGARPPDQVCGPALGAVPPDPPEVFGRATGPEPEPQLPAATTTTTEAPPPEITTVSGERQDWAITIALGVIAAAMVVAALVVRSKRGDAVAGPPGAGGPSDGGDERPPPPTGPPAPTAPPPPGPERRPVDR
ncbi:MAG: hypothetical protein R2702_03915 [Acidimicrobiales bacterium]